jgi:hypothetical protein|nr:MAG TPA: hypothetical protein [Caudoviricetes sp.]
MKRKGFLYESIIEINNLKLADKNARLGKLKQYGVQKHILREDENLKELNELLQHRKYKTSNYSKFEIFEPKHRVIARLPYYPDRIMHWAILLKTKEIFVNSFISNTYSGIKGRGVHKASYDLRKSLQDEEYNKYCLKLDVKKFYENIDHNILKGLLRKKFKDRELLTVFDEIIDSNKVGLPLGSLISQYFANFYLCYLDHYIKENLNVKYYFRYMDDLVILSNNKKELHYILFKIRLYLKALGLEIKNTYQVFPVEKRGIDFVGFRHFHTYTFLRKSIKNNYKKSKNKKRWNGWLIHCDSINLRNKYEG